MLAPQSLRLLFFSSGRIFVNGARFDSKHLTLRWKIPGSFSKFFCEKTMSYPPDLFAWCKSWALAPQTRRIRLENPMTSVSGLRTVVALSANNELALFIILAVTRMVLRKTLETRELYCPLISRIRTEITYPSMLSSAETPRLSWL